MWYDLRDTRTQLTSIFWRCTSLDHVFVIISKLLRSPCWSACICECNAAVCKLLRDPTSTAELLCQSTQDILYIICWTLTEKHPSNYHKDTNNFHHCQMCTMTCSFNALDAFLVHSSSRMLPTSSSGRG